METLGVKLHLTSKFSSIISAIPRGLSSAAGSKN
jgi:hypothetical protein